MKQKRTIKIAAFAAAATITLSAALPVSAATDRVEGLSPENGQTVGVSGRTQLQKGVDLAGGRNVASEGIEAAAYYSIPSGSYPIRVVINGRRVLEGAVYNLNGITYVPLAAFADWVGMFSHSYDKYSAKATLTGENLFVTARAGDLYVIANGRYFYTSEPVMIHGGRIYVPILAATKALNAHVRWSAEDSCFYVGSGDSRLLKNADAVYDADSVFWLARIITAESGGEPLRGKIAVGNVVLNRMRSPSYPNTIYGVIFDKKYGVQFSPVANGTIYNNPTAESIIAAKICLEGYSLSEDILYFVNPTLAPGSWIEKNRPFAFRIGNHAFFN